MPKVIFRSEAKLDGHFHQRSRTVVDGRLSRFKKILSVRVNGPKNSKMRADDLDTIKITFFYRF